MATVRKAGFAVVEAASDAEMEHVEDAARQAEVRHKWTRLSVGLLFSLPLFVFSMARDFGLEGMWAHATRANRLFLALTTPVQCLYQLNSMSVELGVLMAQQLLIT